MQDFNARLPRPHTDVARCRAIQTQAAAELGISERVLHYELKKYGLEGRSG